MKLISSLLFFATIVTALMTHANDTPLTPSRFINVRGSQVAIYESAGTQGPGLLLVHGNSSSANSFARIMRSDFANQYRLVALDLPGYGLSDQRSSYTVALWKQAIATVARETDTEQGVLVGWSLGGHLCIQTSNLLPDLKGLFVFGTPPWGGVPSEINAPQALLSRSESYAGAYSMMGTVPTPLPAFAIRRYATAFFSEDYSDIPQVILDDAQKADGMARVTVALAFGLANATTASPLLQMVRQGGFLPEVPLLMNLKIPMALVHAEHDAFFRYEYMKAIEPLFPTLWRQEVQYVSDSGHIIQWEKPDELIQLLTDFLSENNL
jgi:pimeloyl-ACP methyl ester carboxylesterase